MKHLSVWWNIGLFLLLSVATVAMFPTNETGCLDNEFECDRSNSCIALASRCDKISDCFYNEDEEDCKAFQCSKIQFKCANDFCISREYLCNFEDDCGDASDEVDCKYRECWPSEFRCDNQECIRPGMVCDGNQDCYDNSDESGCLTETCDNGKRIHNKTKCNGWPECEDHADELNCECNTDSGEYFRCPNTRCLRRSKICDGVCDCLGENPCYDERNCEKRYITVNGYRMCKVGSTISCKSTISGVTIERCISSEYICDGFNDCLNGNNNLSDEYGCALTSETEDFSKGDEGFILCGGLDRRKLPKRFICDFQVNCLNGEDEIDCSWQNCSHNEFQCDDGSCIFLSDRCNAVVDCNDKSDETNCTGFVCPKAGKDGKPLSQCSNGQCISSELWCDFVPDCSDGSDESFCGPPKICSEEEFQCDSLNQCIPKHYQCYKDENPRSGCADQSHLKGCSNFTCPEGTYKCKMGPCLKPTLLCDGNFDCLDFWMDEENCTHECFEVCTCIDITANCTGLGLQTIKNIDKMEDPYRKFYFANNNLSSEINSNFTYNIRFAILLDLSNNSICHLTPGIFKDMQALKNFILQNNCLTELESQTFDGLANLNGLHLEGNQIQHIREKAFYGLSSLPTLNLRNQGIEHIAEGAFRGLRKLSSLDLSQNKIKVLYHGTFQDLSKLTYLDLRGNQLRVIESQVFKRPELSIQVLLFDSYKFCCLAKHVPNCQPTSDEFSTCEDLMSNFVLRVCIWVLGIIATLGNLLVIGWRINYKHKNKVHSFLITNLAVGDFFMGFYLLIIATVDTHYRGVYSVHDEEWRSSKLCSLAGFLSTLSSELSVFTLTVITLDRFLVIMFPFKVTRLEMSQIRWVMLGVWIAAVFLSGLPLIYKDYFKNFYGRTGVCLALCITTDKNEGWKYSAFIFVFLNFLLFSVIAIGYVWMYGVAKTTRLAVGRNVESKRVEQTMAKRMILIVATDAACWVPIIFLGILSLNGVTVPSQVFAWVAVFVLPLNAAVNPIFYTISTTTFLDPAKRNIKRFNRSFKFPTTSNASFDRNSGTKYRNSRSFQSYLHHWRPNAYNRNENNLELVRMRSPDTNNKMRKRSILITRKNGNKRKTKEKSVRGRMVFVEKGTENEDTDFENERIPINRSPKRSDISTNFHQNCHECLCTSGHGSRWTDFDEHERMECKRRRRDRSRDNDNNQSIAKEKDLQKKSLRRLSYRKKSQLNKQLYD